MIEQYPGDPAVDFDPQAAYFERGDVEAMGGLEPAETGELFDDLLQTARAGESYTAEELAEIAQKDEQKSDIERIGRLNAEERAHEGWKDSCRGLNYLGKKAKKLRTQAELKLRVGEVGKVGEVDEEKEARNLLVTSNLGVAVERAWRYYPHQHLKKTDLAQEGVIELMGAAKKYDPAKGAKFSTYATPRIRGVLQRTVDNSERTIRWTVPTEENYRPIDWAKNEIERYSHELPATPKELVAYLGEPGSPVVRAMIKEYFLLPQANEDVDSLSAAEQARHAGAGGIDEVEADEDSESIKQRLPAFLAEAGCREREADVLLSRVGLDAAPETLDSIGERYGISRERVRQIEVEALRKYGRKIAKEFITFDT